MSKHFFVSDKDSHIQVDAGWDRPMQHFYLNIYDERLDNGESEYEDSAVYISMYDPALLDGARGPLYGGLSLEELKAKLAELDIPAPKGLLDALDSDKRRNAGNEVTVWEGGKPARRS